MINKCFHRQTPSVYGIATLVVVLALAACEKKTNPQVTTGGGASSQGVISVKGAAR